MSSAASSAREALAQQRVRDRRRRRDEPAARHARDLDAHVGAVARDQRHDARVPARPRPASDAHFAAAIVRFRKKWWLPATNAGDVLAAQRREPGHQVADRAGCRSPGCACAARRPCCRPWAASAEDVDRALALEQPRAAAAPRSSRKKRSRSIASSSPTPNHSVLPGPSLSVENARAPAASSSTTHTGIDGEQTPVIGPTWSCSLPGREVDTRRRRAVARAPSRSPAQPSNRQAATSARRCGSQTRSQAIGGPECSSVRPSPAPARRRPRGRPSPRAAARPRCARRRCALAGVDALAVARPRGARAAATAAGSPPAGGRQSTSTTGAPWSRTASPNAASPTLTASTLREHARQRHGRLRARDAIPGCVDLDAAARAPASRPPGLRAKRDLRLVHGLPGASTTATTPR